MGIFGNKKINGLETYSNETKEKELSEHAKTQRKEKIKRGFSFIAQAIQTKVNFVSPPQTPDQKEYKKKLKEKIKDAKRKAYLKESVRQASLQGKQLASKRHSQSNNYDIMNIVNAGYEQPIKQTIKQTHKKKAS